SIFVSSATTTPTIAIYDDAATGTTVKAIDTTVPAVWSNIELGMQMNNGINVVLAGSVSMTVIFEAI
ncbi:MAG: hypothetical protein ACYDBH_22500, partial [Acidobacteriaceae bacterium]